MADWLRLLLMVFYAPVRGMREARDRNLASAALIAFVSQVAYSSATKRFAVGAGLRFSSALFSDLFINAITLVLIAVVLVPLITLVANTFERRGSFRVVITQEYAPVAATLLYVLMAVNIWAIIIAAFFHFSGIQAAHLASTMQQAEQIRAMLAGSPQWEAIVTQQLADPVGISEGLFRMVKLGLFSVGTVFGVKEVFRISVLRAMAVSVVSCLGVLLVSPIWIQLFSRVLGSPFLVVVLFVLLRGYLGEIMRQHRSKAAFRQNLESATLNPADASAHYNLGLIHEQRGELDAARERFERAVQIDAEEIDAYYQLGRIARQQKRFADAIKDFEQVVARDPSHAQHEIWREVGATYVAAGQYEDARAALEQFLERRTSDPEGLYLMGRAHAGLGHRREAANSMQACIDAVKTAPAYKYRLSKRWLNEAQQFLRSQAS
jgi:tetratricopeptide (TPR) repeat protein